MLIVLGRACSAVASYFGFETFFGSCRVNVFIFGALYQSVLRTNTKTHRETCREIPAPLRKMQGTGTVEGSVEGCLFLLPAPNSALPPKVRMMGRQLCIYVTEEIHGEQP